MKIPFFNELDEAQNILIARTVGEVSLAIEKFRDALPLTKPWMTIPC